MRRPISIFAAAALAATFLTAPASAQRRQAPAAISTLPPQIQAQMRQHYPNWMIVRGSEYCDRGATPAVRGDFNGDGTADYAARMVRGRRGQIVAFISSGRTFRRLVLENDARAEIINMAVGVEPRGSRHAGVRLANDAPVGGTCEASSFVYLIRGTTFRRLFTSD